jgi:hypothetical protein
MIGREIKDDAGTESDREPGQQPAGADLDGRPVTQARGNGKTRPRPKPFPGLARAIDWPGSYAGASAGAPTCPHATLRIALVHHPRAPTLRAPLTLIRLYEKCVS